jgi:hypothetical protein
MTGVRLAVAVLLAAGALQTSLAAAQPADDRSLEHVRAGIEKPPSKLTLREPDFRLHVEAARPLQDIFATPPWIVERATQPRYVTAPSPFGSQPLVSVDLLAIAGSVLDGIRSTRRRHAEAAARDEVNQAIKGYCDAQPNGGAGIQICDKPPANR